MTHNTIHYTWIESPVGELLLTANSQSLIGLHLKGQKHFPEMTDAWKKTAELKIFEQVKTQLAEYFSHQRKAFNLPLSPQGTDFQKQVWQFLLQIPFGQTLSYGDMAHQLGKPGAARAVGAANGRNPISIIVPCHRVIASTGKMTGYAGGIDRKQWLLRHEQSAQMDLFS
ncbi:MAG: methylated-DNA--[protein]-cysteine S-methyltransferase [Cyanobacteria bacterium J06598_3]